MSRWQDQAACLAAPVERFYPSTTGGSTTSARQTIWEFCLGCPVRPECLAEELDRSRRDRHGIRGGVMAPNGGKGTRPPFDPFGVLPKEAW